MDKDTWKRIEELFHRAIELPEQERRDFVREQTVEDSYLRLEVMTLLSSHASQSNILESPEHLSDAVKSLASQISGRGLNESGKASTSISKLTQVEEEPQLRNSSGDAKLISMLERSRKDFVVKRPVNRGGMGVVFRVYQKGLDRDVAVKVISASHLDDQKRRQFIRESKAVAQVKSDHVVSIHEVCQDYEFPFLVMELIEGPSLERFIVKNGQVEAKKAAELARQIALGLHAAHETNLIHRDIKPANVLLEPLDESTKTTKSERRDSGGAKFRARLIDFGLARDVDNPTGETQDQLFAGTLSYMSPEQITRPKSIDHRSDIYSLGMTLYEMLTGEKPFHGAPHMVIQKIEHAEPNPPRKLDDRIPKDIESVCLKALQKDRDRRYQSAMEMANDLQRFIDDLPTRARPISRSEKVVRWISRNRKVSVLAGLAMCLMLALTIGSLIFAMTVQMKDEEIGRQTNLANTNQLQRILSADPAALLFSIEDSDSEQAEILKGLGETFQDESIDLNSRMNAAIALSHLGQSKTGFVISHLDQLFVSPSVCRNILSAVKNDSKAVSQLRNAMEQRVDQEQKARDIILLAHLGEFEPWRRAAEEHYDPTLITEVIHQLKDWHGSLTELLELVKKENDPTIDWTFSQGLSVVDVRSLNSQTRKTIKPWLQNQTEQAEYVNVASAIFVLSKWNEDEPKFEVGHRSDSWYVSKNETRMVRIKPAASTMGRLESAKIAEGYPPHEVRITRPFFIADAEVTVGQFQEYLDDTRESSEGKPEGFESDVFTSPTKEHPINSVSYFDAIRFCNWMSRVEGLTPAYQYQGATRKYQLTQGEIAELEHWTFDDQANGYRLPTEHEWELACRDGTTTKYSYGTQSHRFPSYGLASNNTRIPTGQIRSRLPNRLGLFDAMGNVWELCNDWHSFLDEAPLIDPSGPDNPDPEFLAKVHRGGGVSSFSGATDSEARGGQPPTSRYTNVGFRIARNAE